MYIIFKLLAECSQNEDIGLKEPQPPPQSLPAPRTRSNTVVSHITSAAVLPVTSQVAAGGGREMSIGIRDGQKFYFSARPGPLVLFSGPARPVIKFFILGPFRPVKIF